MPNLFQNLFSGKKPTQKGSPFKDSGTNLSSIQFLGGYVFDREQNPKLHGLLRWTTFEDILVNTSVVAASYRLWTNLISKPYWSVEAVDETPEAIEAKEFAERVLAEYPLNWTDAVRGAALFKFYGANVQEVTYRKADDGAILLASIEQRPMRSIERWEVDGQGTIDGFWQMGPNMVANYYIPRWKTAYLCDNSISDSPQGLGLLRHCVEPSARLKNFLELETQGYERDLRGIPIGFAPLSAINQAVEAGEVTKEQAQSAISSLEQLVTMARKSGSTGAILDSSVYAGTGSSGDGKQISSVKQWDMQILNGGNSTGLKEMADAIARINYEMARVFNTEGLLLGSNSTGSQALANDKSSNLHDQINSTLRQIADSYTRDILGTIWKLNGRDERLMPHFQVEEVSSRDAEKTAVSLKDMVASGAQFLPSDPIYNSLRKDMGYPEQPEEDLAKIEQQEIETRERETAEAEAALNPNSIDAEVNEIVNGGNNANAND